jgi:hypothetical protein
MDYSQKKKNCGGHQNWVRTRRISTVGPDDGSDTHTGERIMRWVDMLDGFKLKTGFIH